MAICLERKNSSVASAWRAMALTGVSRTRLMTVQNFFKTGDAKTQGKDFLVLRCLMMKSCLNLRMAPVGFKASINTDINMSIALNIKSFEFMLNILFN